MQTLSSKYSFVVFFSSVFQFVTSEFYSMDDINKFRYEEMHHFGKGRKVIQDYRRVNPYKSYGYEHPAPLPVKTVKEVYPTDWSSFTQGYRKRSDKRVYSKKFDYKARPNNGHQYYIDGVVDCVISCVVLDTDGATPVKLRGGVGYPYFAFVILAKPGQPLKGRLQTFCIRPDGRRAGSNSLSVETDVDAD